MNKCRLTTTNKVQLNVATNFDWWFSAKRKIPVEYKTRVVLLQGNHSMPL